MPLRSYQLICVPLLILIDRRDKSCIKRDKRELELVHRDKTLIKPLKLNPDSWVRRLISSYDRESERAGARTEVL